MPATEQLTRVQQSALGTLLHMALKEIRLLAWEQQWEQAADLADAVAQLPLRMFSPNFEWNHCRKALEKYQERYPHRGGTDFVKYLDHI